ncbi:hypothetical protein P0Y35_16445 [Kiritimatiellaeota bacterium B1221]|nr:hypothetical protein [Kiritimatiellaeota bacterium B1221]
MNDSQQIDKKLQQWSRNVDQELSQEVPELGPIVLSADQQERLHFTDRRPRLLAMAAGFVILMMAGILFFPAQTDPKSAEGLASLSNVYDELSRLFPDQSVWISEGAEDVEMGMAPLAGPENATRLVLRVIVQKQGDTGSWSEVWRRDIVTSETAWVDTVLNDRPNEKLSVWTQKLSDGVLMLESYLELPHPYAVNAREQVMFTLSDTGPSVNETTLGPGMRLVQSLVEVRAGGQGA